MVCRTLGISVVKEIIESGDTPSLTVDYPVITDIQVIESTSRNSRPLLGSNACSEVLTTVNSVVCASVIKEKGCDFLLNIFIDSGLQNIEIDDKPGRTPYQSTMNQVRAYCLAFKDMTDDKRKIKGALRERGTDNLFWSRAFAQFAKSAMKGEDIVLHTRGDSFGNYCYTADAAAALLTLMLNGEKGQAYTIVNERTTMRIRDVAGLVSKTLSGGSSQVVFDIPESSMTYGFAPDVTMHLSSEKIRRLGWSPKYDLPKM